MTTIHDPMAVWMTMTMTMTVTMPWPMPVQIAVQNEESITGFGTLTCAEQSAAVRVLAAMGYHDAAIADLTEWNRSDVRRALSVRVIRERGPR